MNDARRADLPERLFSAFLAANIARREHGAVCDGDASLVTLGGIRCQASGFADERGESLQRAFPQILRQLDMIGVRNVAGGILQADVSSRADDVAQLVIGDLVG